MTKLDMEFLRTWIGRREVRRDRIGASLIERFRATIPVGLWDGAAVPLGIHWCLGLPALPIDDLGPDGHPARGGFLPPVPLRSRMWAGGELVHHGAFLPETEVVHVARVADVAEKAGRSGPLVFVTVHHDYLVNGRAVVSERQDIVYRDPPEATATPAASVPAGPDPEGPEWLASGPVQMFRYSALTFNGHRIHYDADYARSVEGYPGLVVHGPLQATLLLNKAAIVLGRCPVRFSFRGLAPLISGTPYRLLGNGADLACETTAGVVTMRAAFSVDG